MLIGAHISVKNGYERALGYARLVGAECAQVFAKSPRQWRGSAVDLEKAAAFVEARSSACGWCKDRWGLSWQITPRALTDAMAMGGEVAKRAFEAMMGMGKIDVAAIEAAVRG